VFGAALFSNRLIDVLRNVSECNDRWGGCFIFLATIPCAFNSRDRLTSGSLKSWQVKRFGGFDAVVQRKVFLQMLGQVKQFSQTRDRDFQTPFNWNF